MATGTFTWYNLGKEHLVEDFEQATDTVKVALMSSSYTPAVTTDSTFSGLTGELAAGNGYTAGGETETASVTESAGTVTFDITDAVWTASGGDIGPASYAVIYDSTNDHVIAYLDFSGDPQTASDGNTFTVSFNASGFFTFT